MATKSKSARKFKGLKPGDPVEVVWKDACTQTKWVSLEDAGKLQLCLILTRGTLITVREDAVVIALDTGLLDDGAMGDHHGVGVMEINSVVEIHKLRRVKR